MSPLLLLLVGVLLATMITKHLLFFKAEAGDDYLVMVGVINAIL